MEEIPAMRAARSPGTSRRYPLTMICQVWRVARSSVYATAVPLGPAPVRGKRGPKTLVSDPDRCRRILVVDDDEDERHIDCMMLSRAGYTVDTAADGEEAWKMLLSVSYDLLLSDHNMPRLSAWILWSECAQPV